MAIMLNNDQAYNMHEVRKERGMLWLDCLSSMKGIPLDMDLCALLQNMKLHYPVDEVSDC